VERRFSGNDLARRELSKLRFFGLGWELCFPSKVGVFCSFLFFSLFLCLSSCYFGYHPSFPSADFVFLLFGLLEDSRFNGITFACGCRSGRA